MNIIELAKQAGIPTLLFPDGVEELSAAHERFAALVRAQTLEEAVGIAEEELANSNALAAYNTVQRIRALKEKT